MALTHTNKWIAKFGHRVTLETQQLLIAAVKADIKEARPTVRRKPPVQQAKERKPNRFPCGNGYYNY